MADNSYTRVYLSDSTGINTLMPDEALQESELSDARNLVYGPMGLGSLKKRRGTSKYSSLAVCEYDYIGSCYSGVHGPYYVDQDASNWKIKSGAGSSLKSGTGTLLFGDWASLAGYDLIVDGVNAYKTSDGTSFTAISNVPSGAKWIEVYNNMVFAAGHDGYTVRYTTPGTVETWPITNAHTFTNNSADITTGLLNAGKVLIVFFNKQFHHIQGYGELTQTISYSNTSVGSLSNRSNVLTPYGAFCWSDRGLTWLKDLQDSIDFVTARKLDSSYLVPPGLGDKIHGIWDSVNHCVHMYIPYGGSTTCNMRIDYWPTRDAILVQDGDGVEMASSGYLLMPA